MPWQHYFQIVTNRFWKYCKLYLWKVMKYCLHTKELKRLFITLDNFWHRIWNQGLKLCGKNTPYFFWGFGSKNKQVERKNRNNWIFFGQKLQFYSNFLHNEISETTSFQTTDFRVLIFTADELCLWPSLLEWVSQKLNVTSEVPSLKVA